jgi:hypothetical protein
MRTFIAFPGRDQSRGQPARRIGQQDGQERVPDALETLVQIAVAGPDQEFLADEMRPMRRVVEDID